MSYHELLEQYRYSMNESNKATSVDEQEYHFTNAQNALDELQGYSGQISFLDDRK